MLLIWGVNVETNTQPAFHNNVYLVLRLTLEFQQISTFRQSSYFVSSNAYFVWWKCMQWHFLKAFKWAASLNSCGGKFTSLKRSPSLFIVDLRLVKPVFCWGKVHQAHVWSGEWAGEAKLFSSLTFSPELWQVLQNKGLEMEDGDSSLDPFLFLVWLSFWLILSVLLNDAFLLTVWLAAELFTGSFGMSLMRSQSRKRTNPSVSGAFYKLVCIGQSNAGKQGVHLWVPLGHSITGSVLSDHHTLHSLCPSLHAHIQLKYPTQF